MINNKGIISKHRAAHIEKIANLPTVLSFSTSRNQNFDFLLLFF
jgi:hypothetical protein